MATTVDINDLRTRAEQGDAQAELELGIAYAEGNGVERDPARAFEWVKRAAGRGLPEALNQLGLCHHDGIGVPIDLIAALFYFRAAAALGLADAEFRVGLMYQAGMAMNEPNPNEAALWFLRAGKRGHTAARLARAEMIKRLSAIWKQPR